MKILILLVLFSVLVALFFLSTYGWRRLSKAATLVTKDEYESELAKNLQQHVYNLAHTIGERNVSKYDKLQEAENYITNYLQSCGYQVEFQEYKVLDNTKTVKNIYVTIPGSTRPQEIVVIGAHYDSHFNPGANDNASGAAALLELAKELAGTSPLHTIQLVAFVNEEPPFFKTGEMGSKVFAQAARKNDVNVVAMICLEMLGYYSDQRNSQRYPPILGFFFPNRADFIGIVGNLSSGWLVKRVNKTFRHTLTLPSVAAITFGFTPGVSLSDHWSFWTEKYSAVMITDTAFYRYDHYHKATDTYEKLDYHKMAEIVSGLKVLVLEFQK